MAFVSKRANRLARFLDTLDERRKFHPGLREVRNHSGRRAGILEEVNLGL